MNILKKFTYRACPILILFILALCSEPDIPRPEITSIDPDEGAVGTPVSIIGKNLAGVKTLVFGTTSSYIASKSDNEIVTVVPPGLLPGNLTVNVNSDGGTSNGLSFDVLASEPEVNSLVPDKGPIGMDVTIAGKYLTGVTSVNFGTGTVTNFTSSTDTELKFKVPEGIDPGALDVTVTTPGGTSPAKTFTVVGKPTISEFTPASGPVGSIVSIAGTHFEDVMKVFFGSLEAVFQTQNSELVEATVPPGAVSGKIKVITPGGEALSAIDFGVNNAPTIASFAPATGGTGVSVVITGTGFVNVSALKFNATLAPEGSYTVISATQINAKVPAGATSGKLSVTTAAGTGTSADDFTIVPSPVITTFTPNIGPSGTTVNITGSNFGGVTKVLFGSGEALFDYKSPTLIEATVPASAATGKVKVVTPGGEATSASDFTLKGAPEITSFAPSIGPVGTVVTITGKNFDGGSVVVKFGTINATGVTVVSATEIIANVPAGATTGKISIVAPAGTATSTGDFTILLPPAVTSFSPANGSVGSNIVITGTGLTGTTSVQFNGIDVGSGNFTVNSATQITAKVPGSATSGKISVTNPQGTAVSANNFYITPYISAVSPLSGSSGATITITGTNMENATVRFNATSATPASNTSTSITVVVPAGTSGAVNITIVNLGGTSNSRSFTITSTVVVDEIIAAQNITEQLLLFRGTNLQGATKVMFGATEASVFTNTSKVVTTKIPNSLSPGSYTVTVVTSNGTSNGKTFEVLSTQNPNSGDVSMVNGASVANLPPGYVPPVSNQWYNTFNPDERFLISESDNTVEFTIAGADVASGTITVDKTNNYVEINLAGIRYAGVWTPRTTETDEFGDTHCFAHMTLISAESGKQLELAVEYFDDCP